MNQMTNDKPNSREIIDFALKGNVIRFYIGKNGDQRGDDWDDRPYEHNAGTVYDEYVGDVIDVSIPFDCKVLQPCDGAYNMNSRYCKLDMVSGDVPCIIIIPPEIANERYWDDTFDYWVGSKNIIKIYFGDDISKVCEEILERVGVV